MFSIGSDLSSIILVTMWIHWIHGSSKIVPTHRDEYPRLFSLDPAQLKKKSKFNLNSKWRKIIFILGIKFDLIYRDVDPVMTKKTDPGLCTSNDERFLIVFCEYILDNYKSLPFCFHTFGVRRSIDVLDSEKQPGSRSAFIQCGSGFRALGLTEDVWHHVWKQKGGC